MRGDASIPAITQMPKPKTKDSESKVAIKNLGSFTYRGARTVLLVDVLRTASLWMTCTGLCSTHVHTVLALPTPYCRQENQRPRQFRTIKGLVETTHELFDLGHSCLDLFSREWLGCC